MNIGEALDLLRREVRVEDWHDSALHPYYINSWVHLPNGWEVSVGYGSSHLCSNQRKKGIEFGDSPDCEIKIFTPNDGGYWWWSDCDGHDVFGWIPAEIMLKVVDAVATFREGGPCPCPTCVLERDNERRRHGLEVANR